MAHHAEIEPLSAVIRVWAHPHGRPDPYEYVATLRWVDRATVEVLGVIDGPGSQDERLSKDSLSIVRAMAKALYSFGVTSAYWTRYDANGRARKHWVDTRHWAMKGKSDA